jgi:hypothetical protein
MASGVNGYFDVPGEKNAETKTQQIASMSNHPEIAAISLDFSATFICPSTSGAARKIRVSCSRTARSCQRNWPDQHRKQRQKKRLIERMKNLATLAWVRHIIEVIEKYDRLEKRSTVYRDVFRGCYPPTGSRGSNSFSVLAACEVLLHPIAVPLKKLVLPGRHDMYQKLPDRHLSIVGWTLGHSVSWRDHW